MRLLFAIKTLRVAGGAERVFCTITSGLAQRGHEVLVVTFDNSGVSSFYPLDNRIRRVDLGIGDASLSARFFETLRRMIALRKVVKRIRPHIAIGFMHSMFVPLSFSLFSTGIPVIGSEHIVTAHYNSRPKEFALLVLSALFMRKVTVISCKIFEGYPFPIQQRMVVMPNPIELASGRARPGDKKSCYVLLSVGRLDAQKDQATLIQAFSYLTDKWPDWRLKIFGHGPLRDELLDQIDSLGLVNRVILPGLTVDINIEYQNADIFVLPSLYEAFGLATAEAMSFGLPVVGFADCPGTNELIEDGTCGFLVKPGENRAKSLALYLDVLFADPNLRKQMGEAGLSKVVKMGLINNVIESWENLIKTNCN